MARKGGPGDISSVCVHCAYFLPGLAIWHMMTNIVRISVPTNIATCFYILSLVFVCLSVLRRKKIRMCCGIILTARSTHFLQYTFPNSHMVVRSPRLCSHWSPPRKPRATRSQVLCPVHSYHTVHQLTFSCGPHFQNHKRNNANFVR